MKLDKLTDHGAVAGIILLIFLVLCAFVAGQARPMVVVGGLSLQLRDSPSWYHKNDIHLDLHTSEELYAFAQLVNSGVSFEGKTVRLKNNILLNDTTGWQQWSTVVQTPKAWIPAGTRETPFRGIFDGQGHTISGLFIHSGTESLYQGLFGVIAGATIRNIGITASYIHAYDHVGAIVGFMQSHSKLDACFNEAIVHADRNMVGGLVGRAEGTTTLVNCYNRGMISGNRHVGGLVGNFQNGTIYNCYNHGDVRGKYENIGGIVGCLMAEYDANERQTDTVANCYNTGSVYGRDVIGGLAGYVALKMESKRRKGTYFANCYSAGRLQSRFPFVTDGLVGLYSVNMEIPVSVNMEIPYKEASTGEAATDIEDTTQTPSDIFNYPLDDEKRIIERFGDTCYWNQQSCNIARLEQPRFSRHMNSDQWMKVSHAQKRTPKLFQSVSDQAMQSAAFVESLNTWVEKQGSPFKRWTRDSLRTNGGYPVLQEGAVP